jgi:hypothetical protein
MVNLLRERAASRDRRRAEAIIGQTVPCGVLSPSADAHGQALGGDKFAVWVNPVGRKTPPFAGAKRRGRNREEARLKRR